MEYILITGATRGIGREFARLYGSRKENLIIIGRDRNALEKLKRDLEGQYGIRVETLPLDLAFQDAPKIIDRYVQDNKLDVTLVINNAGIATSGPAHEIPPGKDREMIMVNICSLMEITKMFMAYFFKKGKGSILNVASTGAYVPGPYTASYFASKSFVLNYSLALNYEAKAKGVFVGALCPGTTKTGFFESSNQKCPKWAMDPARVAKIGARQIARKKPVQIVGSANRLLTMLPARVKIAGIAKIKRKGS